MIAFQFGSDDARVVTEQLGKYPGQISPQKLTSLPKYTAYTRLLIDGMPSQPFSMTANAPPAIDDDRLEIVRRTSQRQFSKPIEQARHLTDSFTFPKGGTMRSPIRTGDDEVIDY